METLKTAPELDQSAQSRFGVPHPSVTITVLMPVQVTLTVSGPDDPAQPTIGQPNRPTQAELAQYIAFVPIGQKYPRRIARCGQWNIVQRDPAAALHLLSINPTADAAALDAAAPPINDPVSTPRDAGRGNGQAQASQVLADQKGQTNGQITTEAAAP